MLIGNIQGKQSGLAKNKTKQHDKYCKKYFTKGELK